MTRVNPGLLTSFQELWYRALIYFHYDGQQCCNRHTPAFRLIHVQPEQFWCTICIPRLCILTLTLCQTDFLAKSTHLNRPLFCCLSFSVNQLYLVGILQLFVVNLWELYIDLKLILLVGCIDDHTARLKRVYCKFYRSNWGYQHHSHQYCLFHNGFK